MSPASNTSKEAVTVGTRLFLPKTRVISQREEGKCEPGDGEHVDYDVENTVETVEVENADVVARATLAQRWSAGR